MNKFDGTLGVGGLLFTIAALIWFTMKLTLYFAIAYEVGFENIQFALLFNLIMGFFLVILPWLSVKLNVSNKSIERFLEIPPKRSRVTFPVLADFLSQQALGSFIGTFLIVTTRNSFDTYHWALSTIYCAFLFLISIFIVTCSFVRFSSYFRESSPVIKFFIFIFIALIVHMFYQFGIELASV
ncbi:hypothetical protein [Alteromonas stellipolaris]|uniref:hypothetical protein n=1 Tax=Alteromonas stellipolaris TaxID=233316 RepID=UPI0026E1A21C|nr:hypothetical protein [Alteromonas stellipolaris]MDO6533858.1 hypothetical protein [Alteromonas stellipolaris]MDO6626248.1 hypothetical protein [Alteromonas stellipolaris]